ncbi:hypothetical protein HU200_018321 [Digitaria exilis]|uniref:WAT1-related protein n=1 Tax=Digitaria exilis TaxID=1010633 RepID=A0A835F603_9POAL|nr:hypothetical protein HU200_018321 [Digitaria exilis]
MAPPSLAGTSVWMMYYAPHGLMILAQLFFTLLYFITEAAFNRGLNPYVYVTYRHLLVACENLEGLSEKLHCPFLLASCRGSLTLNMYFSSLKYTSPTFVTSMVNAVASITFVIAIILRMEIVDVRSLRGLAKIAGTMVSFAGVGTISLYKGAGVKNLWKPPIRIHGSGPVVVHESWVKGSLLAVASCICWSVCFILQVPSYYNNEQKVTVYMQKMTLLSFFYYVRASVVQERLFLLRSSARKMMLIGERKRNLEDWLIGFGLKFWCVVYTGIACNGLTVVIQLWCNKKKGPVFVTMFNPLLTVMVTILAYFIFGENLYVGSIIGGILVILGLYMLLWGKDRDQEHRSTEEQDSELDCEKQATVSDVAAARNDQPPKLMK